MYKLLLLFYIIACISCAKTGASTPPKNLNKTVSFNIVDSIICNGDSGLTFSPDLYPIRNNSTECIASDLMTKNLLFYNKSIPNTSRIIDLKSKFQMYNSLPNSLFGVVEVKNKNFLICSKPYFLLVDSLMNIINVYNINIQEDSINYYRIGDITNIQLNSNKSCIYFPIAPDIPHTNPNAFNKGRVVEINLDNGTFKVLPIKLPFDYEVGKDYKLFSLPNITIFKDKLYCIYPGSNYLYNYDLHTTKLDSTFISPKHVTINVKEVGTKMEDMIFSYLECNNFYHIASDNNMLLLLYWEGKKRRTFSMRNGLEEINCYIMGYDPIRNELLFDTPFNLKNVLKKPYMYNKNSFFLIQNQQDNETRKIQSKILKYEMIVK